MSKIYKPYGPLGLTFGHRGYYLRWPMVKYFHNTFFFCIKLEQNNSPTLMASLVFEKILADFPPDVKGKNTTFKPNFSIQSVPRVKVCF